MNRTLSGVRPSTLNCPVGRGFPGVSLQQVSTKILVTVNPKVLGFSSGVFVETAELFGGSLFGATAVLDVGSFLDGGWLWHPAHAKKATARAARLFRNELHVCRRLSQSLEGERAGRSATRRHRSYFADGAGIRCQFLIVREQGDSLDDRLGD